MKQKTLLLAILLCFCFQSFAFDALRHRIISEIAYQNLKYGTRKKVNKLLGIRGIVYTSVCADDERSDSKYAYSYNWHFQNLKNGITKTELQFLLDNPKSEGEHLFFALDSLTVSLKHNKNNAESLKFIIHFFCRFISAYVFRTSFRLWWKRY